MENSSHKYNTRISTIDYRSPRVVKNIIHDAESRIDDDYETMESYYCEPPLFNQTASCGLTPLKSTQVTKQIKPEKENTITNNSKSISGKPPAPRAFENSMSLDQSRSAIGEIAAHLDISERAATILARYGLVHTKRYAQ